MGDGGLLVQGQMIERKAIGRMLAYQAARAAWRYTQAPWWRFVHRLRLRWTLAALTNTIRDVELGACHTEQTQWLQHMSNEEIDRAVAAAVSTYEAA